MEDVSKALHITPAYFYKKIKDLSPDNAASFVDAEFHPLPTASGLVISIEASVGSMEIEGAADHSLKF